MKLQIGFNTLKTGPTVRWFPILALGGLCVVAACDESEPRSPFSPEATPPGDEPTGAAAPGPAIFSDLPIAGLSEEDEGIFADGDELFDTPFRLADGLGPLFTHQACSGCHSDGVRGPGAVQKMVVVEADGFTPKADQRTLLPYGNTVHPQATEGVLTIMPPAGEASVKVSRRVGPAVVGRGYIEAIRDDEIERVAREQAEHAGSVKGRINHVVYQSEANPDQRFHQLAKGAPVIGRFGLKARLGTLDDFSADAAQSDMGLTSPLRPTELANPSNASDNKPGPDLSLQTINKMANYIRMLGIPRRGPLEPRGARLFAQVGCASCHTPALKTRADYPIAALADIDAPIYSDLLLHDMGEALADGIGSAAGEGEAGPREWRTTPLIALRFNRTLMHDGRAKTVEAAVLAHESPGSQASPSVARWRTLPEADRATLRAFVEAL
jgi:CxxC motif-containing protein (DUF1111 family)